MQGHTGVEIEPLIEGYPSVGPERTAQGLRDGMEGRREEVLVFKAQYTQQTRRLGRSLVGSKHCFLILEAILVMIFFRMRVY